MEGTVGSKLKVLEGVEQPSSLNTEIINKLKKKKKGILSDKEYFDGIIKSDRSILAQAITLIESNKKEHLDISSKIISRCLPLSGKSLRVGITGVPGVGKSTFIEALGKKLTLAGNKVAVLAVDPSSDKSKGSILGDKTRMSELATDNNAFIRPSPSSGTLGGVARKTRETVILCEAAGYNIVFIETVGVGQSETTVHSMVDVFLLLMLPGAGDELQGIKRGIMELTDILVLNKSDECSIDKLNTAVSNYQNALHLFPPDESEWTPVVTQCSSIQGSGIEEVWSLINNFITFTKNNGFFENNRMKQSKYWFSESLNNEIKNLFYSNPVIKKKIHDFENKVAHNLINPFDAAIQLLNEYRDILSSKTIE